MKLLMTENEIVDKVLDICFMLHRMYGPGLLESAYESMLCYELRKAGIPHTRQQPIDLIHDGEPMETAYRADVIVMEKVLFELKSIKKLEDIHPKYVLTYIRIADLRLGVIVNFNEVYLKDGIKRVANHLV